MSPLVQRALDEVERSYRDFRGAPPPDLSPLGSFAMAVKNLPRAEQKEAHIACARLVDRVAREFGREPSEGRA